MELQPTRRVIRASQWFNFYTLLFAYLAWLVYAYVWFFSDVKCIYDFHTFEAWNCVFWNYGIFVPWFPVVALYLRSVCLATETGNGTRRFSILNSRNARLYILNGFFLLAYTVLMMMRVAAAPLGSEMAKALGDNDRMVGLVYLLVLFASILCYFLSIPTLLVLTSFIFGILLRSRTEESWAEDIQVIESSEMAAVAGEEGSLAREEMQEDVEKQLNGVAGFPENHRVSWRR